MSSNHNRTTFNGEAQRRDWSSLWIFLKVQLSLEIKKIAFPLSVSRPTSYSTFLYRGLRCCVSLSYARLVALQLLYLKRGFREIKTIKISGNFYYAMCMLFQEKSRDSTSGCFSEMYSVKSVNSKINLQNP